MAGGSAAPGPALRAALGDFARLFVKAFFGGLGAALALAVATLALASTARASCLSPGEPIAATTGLHAGGRTIVAAAVPGNEPWSVAPTPFTARQDAGVGALWATSSIVPLVGDPGSARTDTPATLQLFLGLMALVAAGTVAVVGRHTLEPA